MLDLFQVLKCPDDLMPIIHVVKNVFLLIQIGVPILLIVMGSIDLGKAVMSSDDKEIKGATGKLIKRAIAAVAVFFIVPLVNLVISFVAGSGAEDADSTSWKDCWNKAGK